jgi:hypothetical protein
VGGGAVWRCRAAVVRDTNPATPGSATVRVPPPRATRGGTPRGTVPRPAAIDTVSTVDESRATVDRAPTAHAARGAPPARSRLLHVRRSTVHRRL